MQPEFGSGGVPVDEAGVRIVLREAALGGGAPRQIEKRVRHGRPRLAARRVDGIVAVAAPVGDQPVRPQLVIATDMVWPPGTTRWRKGASPAIRSTSATSASASAVAKPRSSTAPSSSGSRDGSSPNRPAIFPGCYTAAASAHQPRSLRTAPTRRRHSVDPHPTAARLRARPSVDHLPPQAAAPRSGETQPTGTRRIRLPTYPRLTRRRRPPRHPAAARPPTLPSAARPEFPLHDASGVSAVTRTPVYNGGAFDSSFPLRDNKGVCESSAPPFSLSRPGLEWNAFFS